MSCVRGSGKLLLFVVFVVGREMDNVGTENDRHQQQTKRTDKSQTLGQERSCWITTTQHTHPCYLLDPFCGLGQIKGQGWMGQQVLADATSVGSVLFRSKASDKLL